MAVTGLPDIEGGDIPSGNATAMDEDEPTDISRNRNQNELNLSTGEVEERPEVDSSSDDENQRPLTNVNIPDNSTMPGRIIPSEGIHVDILDSVKKWSEAEILKVDKQNGRVYITYLYWDNKWNEWVDLDSGRIAPLGTRTYVEGGALQLGMRVECCDERRMWLEAEVVEVSNDRAKIHYRGWKDTYDEWVPCIPRSDKIRPYGREKPVAQTKRNTTRYTAPLPTSQHVRAIKAIGNEYLRYSNRLNEHGFQIYTVEGDGNCLFRSISHQVYGDDKFHALVREKCMDYMLEEALYFEPYIEGDMNDFYRYIELKRKNGVWGDDPEVQAMCEMYDRPAEIWAYDPTLGARKLRTFHEALSDQQQSQPMRLSYYGGGHYDSIYGADHDRFVITHAPGKVEEEAIEHAHRRKTTCSAGAYEEAKQRSDMEETDRATINLALEASRREFDAQQEDFDAVLVASLNQLELEQEGTIEPHAMEDGIQHNPALVQVQNEILQSVLQQSEEEQLRKAMEISLQEADEDPILKDIIKTSAMDEDVFMNEAIQASLGPGMCQGYDFEDPELAAALKASIYENPQEHLNGIIDDEEELMRIAMEESLCGN